MIIYGENKISFSIKSSLVAKSRGGTVAARVRGTSVLGQTSGPELEPELEYGCGYSSGPSSCPELTSGDRVPAYVPVQA
jgi:hypothetical protein